MYSLLTFWLTFSPTMAFKSSLSRKMISTMERIEQHNDHSPLDPSVHSLMQSISDTQSTLKTLSELAPKLYAAQRTQHKYTRQLIHQLQDTFISSASLSNAFSNPEDPFAELCRAMGSELAKFELSELDYLQKIRGELIEPVKAFHTTQFKLVYPLHLKYKRAAAKTLKHSKSQKTPKSPKSPKSPKTQKTPKTHMTPVDDALSVDAQLQCVVEALSIPHSARAAMFSMSSAQKLAMIRSYQEKAASPAPDPGDDALSSSKAALFREMARVKRAANTALLEHVDSFWKGLFSLCKTRMHIVQRSRLRDDQDGDDDKEGNEEEFATDFSCAAIDEMVGFDDVRRDMAKYMVRHRAKRGALRYKRVIYVDSTRRDRSIKLLSLKQRIREYTLSEVAMLDQILLKWMFRPRGKRYSITIIYRSQRQLLQRHQEQVAL